MGDLQVAIGTGRLDPKKHGGCLDLRLATISLDKKQCQSDKKPNNLHYIFESRVPLSPAERLQDLMISWSASGFKAGLLRARRHSMSWSNLRLTAFTLSTRIFESRI